VAVDDLEGSLHRQLGPANTAYVIGADGRVVARVLWAVDERGVRAALDAAVHGDRTVEWRTRIVPILRGAVEQHRILGLAGPRARRDLCRAAPPVFVAGLLASRLPRSLPPLARGTGAALLTAAPLAVGAVGAAARWRRAVRRAREPTR
jgi:hypothetical protein